MSKRIEIDEILRALDLPKIGDLPPDASGVDILKMDIALILGGYVDLHNNEAPPRALEYMSKAAEGITHLYENNKDKINSL